MDSICGSVETSNPSIPTNDLKYTVLMWFAPYCRHLLAKRLLSEGRPRLFPLRTPNTARHLGTVVPTNVSGEDWVIALSWKRMSPLEYAGGHNTDARQGTTTTEREQIRLKLETQYTSNDLEIARQIMTGSGQEGRTGGHIPIIGSALAHGSDSSAGSGCIQGFSLGEPMGPPNENATTQRCSNSGYSALK